jgi:hypothetical protein
MLRAHALTATSVLLAIFVIAAGPASGQSTNSRLGKWKLKSTNAAPASNVMTYDQFGQAGMKITIDAVNRDGAKSQWSYTTNFDGKDEPITGNPGVDHGSVRVITPSINEIVYRKDGKITQILTNVLSPDSNTIGIIYMRQDAEGKTTNVTFATYERMQ